MGKITNRQEALSIKNKVCEVKDEYLKGDKCFDEFERQLVSDLIASRIDGSLTGAELFQ